MKIDYKDYLLFKSHYKIFISSTFKDMDLERDILKNTVIPALNLKYKGKHIDFQAVDLRYGIDTTKLTEAEASKKVVRMCLNTIDQCRPFFIGFVGSRYGWEPDKELWQDVYSNLNQDQKSIMKESLGMSVTEMEIYYALSNEESVRNIFFIRTDDSLNSLSQKCYSDFVDGEEQKVAKLKKLKNRLLEYGNTNESVKCVEYSVNYQDVNLSRKLLAKYFLDVISSQIDVQLEAIESLSSDSIFEELYIDGSDTLSKFYDASLNSLKREPEDLLNQGNIIISGPPYSGKSTFLARHFFKLYNEDFNATPGMSRKILLAAVVNGTKYSRTMTQIMSRWVIELARLTSCKLTPQQKECLCNSKQEDKDVVLSYFYALVDYIREIGHTVHVFIDDVDKFAISSPGDEQLSWVDDRVTLYVTVTNNSEIALKVINNLDCLTLSIPDYVCGNVDLFIQLIESKNCCELPQSIKNVIKSDSCTFIQLYLIYTLITLLNEKDFNNARLIESYQDFMNGKVENLFNNLPESYWGVFDYLKSFLSKRSDNPSISLDVIDLIIHSPIGLRESDIINLVKNKISVIELYELLYHLKAFIVVDEWSGLIHLKHVKKFNAVNEIDKRILNYVDALPDSDWFRDEFCKCNFKDLTTAILAEFRHESHNAKVCISVHKYQDALRHINNALTLYKKETTVDLQLVRQMYYDKMSILMCLDEIEKALYLFNHLVKLDSVKFPEVHVSQVRTQLDLIFEKYNVGDLGYVLHEMLKIKDAFNDSVEASYLYNSFVASLYYVKEQYDTSSSFRFQALKAAMKLPSQMQICIAHTLWNYAFQVSENETDAIDDLLSAIEIYERIGYVSDNIPRVYKLLAELYYKLGDNTSALKYYKMALSKQLYIDDSNADFIRTLQTYIAELENE